MDYYLYPRHNEHDEGSTPPSSSHPPPPPASNGPAQSSPASNSPSGSPGTSAGVNPGGTGGQSTPGQSPQTSPAGQTPGDGSPGLTTVVVSTEGTGATTITTLIPITTVTQPSATFTSFSESVITTTVPLVTISSTTFDGVAPTQISQDDPGAVFTQTCAGQGLDAAAIGILTSLIVPGLIGIILWITFALLRPRFRQVYALREWFVQEGLRSKQLGKGFFAWLNPPVPLRPPIPTDVSDAGRSTAGDAKLFPSDEQLSQRTLFVALLIAFGWSILALAGALPLYLIGTPCHAEGSSPAVYGGGYSTLTDLSLLRLLRLLETENVSILSTSHVARRALQDDEYRTRTRIIILTGIAIVFGLLPALWKIIREFNGVAAYRQRWLQVQCENTDLGWLKASSAPGFASWGETQFKEYLVRIGLSSQLGEAGKKKEKKAARRNGRNRRREEELPLNTEESNLEVDIHSLFSITDTEPLAVMIDRREEILDNLEVAETKYISMFRVTTPDPSILDFAINAPAPDPNKPYISRPLPLAPQRRSRGARRTNRAYGASSFVAPSSFYRLRSMRGVSGGRFTDSGLDQTLADSIQSRVIGSRFMEVNRNSQHYGRLPLGAHVGLERDGELGPLSDTGSWLPPIPDPRFHGPNYYPYDYEGGMVDEHGMMLPHHGHENGGAETTIAEETEEEWVDLIQENPRNEWETDVNGTPRGTVERRPRPPPKDYVPSSRRETFPLRRDEPKDADYVPPPHLRLQPSQPFVRPLEGVNFDDLGGIYNDITVWRSELKSINQEIADMQAQNYLDIANGQGVKGWLMVGKGLRHIPGVELIEGRAKEDIRWDVLQNQRTWLDTAVLWAVVAVIMVLLALGLAAATGLSLAMAPDFAHYLPFLEPLLTTHPIAAGVATVFAPAVAATVFIILALYLINRTAKIHGSVSVSGNQLLVFKITFFALTFIGTLWLVGVGALLYSMHALNSEEGETKSLADGAIYMSILALALVLNVAIIVPACLLLQPFRLWRVIHSEKESFTPRQRFRATFPRTYNPSYAMGACILAIVFASTFALIFPLIAPAVVLFLLLTLIAHRYLVGYVYVRTHSQTGGVLQLWLLKRFGSLLAMQPILLGLIFLTRGLWIEGGVLVGVGVFVVLFVESYCAWKTRLPGYKSLSPTTRHSVEQFASGADTYLDPDRMVMPANHSKSDMMENNDGMRSSVVRSDGMRTLGSFASVLDMMSRTLAVAPSSSAHRGAVPLDTENLNDLTATERAARTHPDAPPRLPPLPFTEHIDGMLGVLYAPELVAPPPIIWLPNDSAGVAQSEAADLQRFHQLFVTIDVRTRNPEDLHLAPTRTTSRH